MTDRIGSPPRRVWPTALAAAAPALVLALLLLLPFLDKAYTIDDTVFLAQARHLLVDPLHPTAFEMVWGEKPERVSAFLASGPTTAALLAPLAFLHSSERGVHLLWLAILAAGVVATAALALRAGADADGARLAALFVAASPAVIGMAGTAMPDVPAMAAGAIGVERFLAWRESGRPAPAVVGAIALAIGMLGRTHLAALLLPLAILAILPVDRRPVGASLLRAWPLLLAGTFAAGVLLLTRDPLGGAGGGLGPTLWRLAKLSPERLFVNLFAFGSHLVLVLPVGLVRLATRGRALFARGRWLAIPLATVAMAAAGFHRWALLAPIAVLGALALADLLTEAAASRDRLRLFLVGWLLVPLPAVVYLQFPPKFLVVSAPAAALLAVLDLAAAPARRRRATALALVAAGSVLGVAILRADAAFAGLGRQAAAVLIAPRVAAGEKVWYTGHWGFQHYADEAGGRIVTAGGPLPAPGDFVVSALRADYERTIRLVPGREPVATLSDARPGGRILSRRAMAGFYTNWIGPLPWSWGDDEVERFDLWRIARAPGGAAR